MLNHSRPTVGRTPASWARLVAMKRVLDASEPPDSGVAEDVYADLCRAICTRLAPEELRRFDEIERHWGEQRP